MRSELFNQRGESVFELENTVMFLKREARMTRMSLDEFFEIGVATPLGSHTFDAESIKAFARKYDPQPFHIDEEAAKKSVFGGLCASGWQTAATWMKLQPRDRPATALGRPGPRARIRPLARHHAI